VKARESGSERFDGASVRLGGWRVVREVVDEGGVDHSIRSGCSAPQALEVVEGTAMHLRSCGGERFGCLIGASEADYLMAHVDQLSDDSGTYKAGGAGDENPHILFLLSCSVLTTRQRFA
jgi:hypothetical protein